MTMANIPNPLGFKLQQIQEKTTGNHWYKLQEADGGDLKCPEASTSREKITCSSKCAKFLTVCRIPQGLGLMDEIK